MDAVDEVITAFEQRYVLHVEAFVFPLLLSLLIEIFRLCREDNMSDLGFVQDVEEAPILRVEPGYESKKPSSSHAKKLTMVC